jgi:hypothetical protein
MTFETALRRTKEFLPGYQVVRVNNQLMFKAEDTKKYYNVPTLLAKELHGEHCTLAETEIAGAILGMSLSTVGHLQAIHLGHYKTFLKFSETTLGKQYKKLCDSFTEILGIEL